MVFLSFSSTFAFGQEDDFIARLKTQLLLYRTQKSEQIIVIQTDKLLYRQGETIWMKGYVSDAITHSLSLNSRELSVLLTDNKGVNVSEGKFLLRNGVANFNFSVPSDLPSNVYYLVAYTPEMENNGIRNIFKREICIGRPESLEMIPHMEYSKPAFSPDCKETANFSLMNLSGKPLSGKKFEYQILSEERELLSGKGKTGTNGTGEVVFFTPPAKNGHPELVSLVINSGKDRLNLVSKVPLVSEKIDVTFFPEGGSRVPGISQLIVYEAKDQFGNPVDVKSDIIDEQGKIVVTAATMQPGLGAFSLMNSETGKLRLRIVSDIGKNQETILPPITAGSMCIAVNKNDGQNLQLLLGRSPDAESEKFRIVAVINGEMIWASDFELGKSGVINIPLDNFHSEIAAFAIFSQSGALVGQRLVYTGKSKSPMVTIVPDKNVYHQGEEGENRSENYGYRRETGYG